MIGQHSDVSIQSTEMVASEREEFSDNEDIADIPGLSSILESLKVKLLYIFVAVTAKLGLIEEYSYFSTTCI